MLKQLGILQGVWLDCGCADGGYTELLLAYGCSEVVGIDVEADRIQAALGRGGYDGRLRFVLLPDETGTMPFPNESFDGVLLNEVLEHVRDEDAVIAELYRVLRPGGVIVVMSPNRWFPFEGHGMHIGAWNFSHPVPVVHWLPAPIRNRLMHARTYWPHELRGLVQRQGFRIVHTDFVLPVLEFYPWLPRPLIPAYRRMMPLLAHFTGLRAFVSVSTLVIGRK